MPDKKLIDFIFSEKQLLDKFFSFWQRANKVEPEEFPLELTDTLWGEQLEIFSSCVKGCSSCNPEKCKLYKFSFTENTKDTDSSK